MPGPVVLQLVVGVGLVTIVLVVAIVGITHRSLMRGKPTLAAALLLTSLFVVGCEGTEFEAVPPTGTDGTTTTASASDDGQTIQLFVWAEDEFEAQTYEILVEEFTANTGISVELNVVGP